MKNQRHIALSVAVAAALGIAAIGIDTTGATAWSNAATTPTLASSGQQVTLAFKYRAGDELVYEQVMSQAVEMQGMPSVGGTEIASTVRWKVLEVADNGDATIEATTERVHGTIAGPTGVQRYDSASDAELSDPMMKILAAQAGLSFTFVLTPGGELVSIGGAEEMRRLALEAMPEDQRGMAAPMLDEMFTVDRGLVLSNSMSALMQMAISAAGQEMVMDMNMTMDFELVEGGQ